MKKINRFLKKLFYKNRTTGIDTNACYHKISKHLMKGIQNITLIDIGSNRGEFLDDLQKHFINARIKALLIEPIPECVIELKKRFGNNSNVTIGQYAVSNIVENRVFYINQFDVTSSLLIIKNGIQELDNVNTTLNKSIVLTTNTLDNIVNEYHFNLKRIDIIKIDVQGFEDKVLQGSKETLKKTKFISIEVSFKALYDGSCLFADVHKILNDLNFILIEISDEFRSPLDELLQANCLYKNIKLEDYSFEKEEH
jgi:FkbM family methyltransferase